MSPVTPRFTLIENFPAELLPTLPPSLTDFTVGVNDKAILLRLLCGTLKFKCNLTGNEIEQKSNYAFVGLRPNDVLNAKSILDSFKFPVTLSELDEYLTKGKGKNSKFYKDILEEFLLYFYEQESGHTTKAFLHLYRILEALAYVFPLIWASRAEDYQKTFAIVRSYFSKPDAGELGALKLFLEGFIDPATVYNVKITIEVNSMVEEWQNLYYEALRKT